MADEQDLEKLKEAHMDIQHIVNVSGDKQFPFWEKEHQSDGAASWERVCGLSSGYCE